MVHIPNKLQRSSQNTKLDKLDNSQKIPKTLFFGNEAFFAKWGS